MGITIYIKNWKCDIYTLKKEKYQYITKKYYLVYLVKKEKYIDYKDLLYKYINDINYFTLLIYLFCSFTILEYYI